MATKLTQIKNPLTTSSGNLLDVGLWLGGILWVVMFGMIFAMGSKALSVIDSKLPGNQTPNLQGYTQPSTGSGINLL